MGDQLAFTAVARKARYAADLLPFSAAAKPVVITAGTLPFAATTRTHAYPADQLPFNCGAQGGGDNGGEPKPVTISSCFFADYSPTLAVSNDLSTASMAHSVSRRQAVDWSVSLEAAECYHVTVSNVPSVSGCTQTKSSPALPKMQCLTAAMSAVFNHNSSHVISSIDAIERMNCVDVHLPPALMQQHCDSIVFVPSFTRENGYREATLAWSTMSCHQLRHSPSLQPRCDYYDLPVDPVEPPYEPPCGLPPPADQLPFRAVRNVKHDSDKLPFRFACRNDNPITPPNQTGYIMYNTITATLKTPDGDVPIGLISGDLNSDMAGFCWQFAVEVSPLDFDKLAMDTRERGDEAIITLTINGERFDFIAEDYSDNRAFNNNSYTVRGRSITAKLSSDYAVRRNETYALDYTAQYIAQQQVSGLYLNNQQVTINYQLPAWVVLANTYAVQKRTAIETIMEIAHTGGGFVSSHPYLPELSMKRRWIKPAWEIKDVTPAVSVPALRIESISGSRQVSEQCHAIRLAGQSLAFTVYRQAKGKYPEASSVNHALYSDIAIFREAGLALLSETGTHKTEAVRLPIDPDLGVPRANVGEVWQFNEGTNGQNGAIWKAVITGVSIDISRDNDAVTLHQILTVNRYLGD